MYKRLPSIQIQLKINLLIFFIYSINIYKHKKVFAPAKNPIPIPLKFAEFLDTMPPSMDYIYIILVKSQESTPYSHILATYKKN